jgi:hypothetical protein
VKLKTKEINPKPAFATHRDDAKPKWYIPAIFGSG